MDCVVPLVCLWIALALKTDSVLELSVHKTEEINKIQQVYYLVSSLFFSGNPESQYVLSLWGSLHWLSRRLVKTNTNLKGMHKSSFNVKWKKT